MSPTALIASAVALLVLVLLQAFLAATETVLLRLNIARAMRMEDEAPRPSASLVWLLEHRGRAMNATLLNTVGVRVTSAVLAVALALQVLPAGLAEAAAVLALSIASMVLGEVAPRTLTARDLEATALRLARPAELLVRATSPFASALVTVGRALVGTRPDVSGPYPSDEEMRRLLDVADEDADDPIEDEEREMIRSIFGLGDTLVREIMVPRPDMVTVEEGASLRELVNTINKNGRSRIPVQRESRDDIAGVVYAKDVLRQLAMQPGVEDWSALVREAAFVPEAKRIDELLRELQEQAVHLALVVDEYGAVVGLVTIEDILEEIVGEIVDEHDREEPLVTDLGGGRLRVDARFPVAELSAMVAVELPQDGWDSVGGLVFGVLGRVPEPGESVELEGLRFTAERVQGRRISQVLVETVEPAEEAATA